MEAKRGMSTREKITFPKIKLGESISWRNVLKSLAVKPPTLLAVMTQQQVNLPVEKRIGILDRKLRVINENVDNSGKWLLAAQDAYKSTYGFEWQGDGLTSSRSDAYDFY